MLPSPESLRHRDVEPERATTLSAQIPAQTLRYRPDIDGLRGIAVLAVVLYHAHVPGFSGGYVGVDVFFVISGYLITQLLEATGGTGSPRAWGEFYLRRARRLLPALLVLLAAAAIAATVLFLPADLVRFGRGLLLATVFLGNVGAWLDGGYFAPGWRFTPLRHLWSIGVEEQFYLIFPLVLFGILRLPTRWRTVLVALLALSSLSLAIWAATRWPVQNYYLLPTRGWELLVGVWAALYPRPACDSKRTGLAALAFITLAAVVWQASFEHFPSIANLAACASTALLIRTNSGTQTAIGRALSVRPLVFTGLISYSLYLWHAPVLAFASYYSVTEPSGPSRALLLALIYAVSALSWRYVERPFRARSPLRAARLLLRVGVPVMALLASYGYWLWHSTGLPGRFDATVLRLAATDTQLSQRPIEPRCLNLSDLEIERGQLCSFGPTDDSAGRIVVWGDSHAQALLPAYRSLADRYHLRIYFAVKGACWPLLGSEAGAAGNFWHERCTHFNQLMAQGIRQLRPQRVVLNAYWRDASSAGWPQHVNQLLRPEASITRGIERTLAAVGSAGASACVVLTVPGYPYPIPYARAMAEQRHLAPSSLVITREAAVNQFQDVERQLRAFAGRNQLLVVDAKDAMCPGDRCVIAAPDGGSLYEDANHLSVAGSQWVSPVLARCIADLEPGGTATSQAPATSPGGSR